MGYFSNGIEFEIFEDNNCSHCKHDDTEERSCPIKIVHSIYNYEACNNELASQILGTMIPRDDDGFCRKCNFFEHKGE